jgi:uncharacterized membrane protein
MIKPKQNLQYILKIIGLILIFQNILLAKENISTDHNHTKKEVIQMDSLGEIGAILLVLLTSTIGSLFLKDQMPQI